MRGRFPSYSPTPRAVSANLKRTLREEEAKTTIRRPARAHTCGGCLAALASPHRLERSAMDLPGAKRVTVIPTGAALGADITGVDLSRPLDEATFKAVESAWHQHLVLRFR